MFGPMSVAWDLPPHGQNDKTTVPRGRILSKVGMGAYPRRGAIHVEGEVATMFVDGPHGGEEGGSSSRPRLKKQKKTHDLQMQPPTIPATTQICSGKPRHEKAIAAQNTDGI